MKNPTLTTKPRKWSVYKTTYLITDERFFSEIMQVIDYLTSEQRYGEAQKEFEYFDYVTPAQSKGVKIGNTVMVFQDGEWIETEVTQDNLLEVKKLCGIGTVTHQYWKIEIEAAQAA